jgi:diadenosine tetraphosphate (Ap4A) HIT family hydrolase
MTSFDKLKEFISKNMRMSQIYQPVMLIELLRSGGKADIPQIAEAILKRDPTQIEYYSEVVKNMVGKVLTNSRGITERISNSYHLHGFEELSSAQIEELIQICEAKIEKFENDRGDQVWNHRRRGHRPISGSIRYEVLKRAAFRCELCGISAEVKNLEVDHINPRSLGGSDSIVNFQALCYSCNAAKRNTDSTDFRDNRTLYDHRVKNCLFCEIQTIERQRIIAENELAYAIRDGFPVTEGHTLIIPKRHVKDYFSLKQSELNSINQLIRQQKLLLEDNDSKIDGFNIGINNGEAAGQTIFHCHIHLIPRRSGDVDNPRGGVRHIIAGKGNY